MDFLKTLLAYMTVTLVVAVESTSTPMVTPVPTPAPTPQYTEQAAETTPVPSEIPTDTPEPTVSVTPVPVPTITPNQKAYHNLAQGDRGEDVRRLQERLIELGYLPEGSADGAFGGQTRLAVRRFQYYNGLTVDGVAGRATQTNLFENPDAARYPDQETPTPAVTDTPAPTDTPVPTDTPEPTVTPFIAEIPVPTEDEVTAAAPEETETEEAAAAREQEEETDAVPEREEEETDTENTAGTNETESLTETEETERTDTPEAEEAENEPDKPEEADAGETAVPEEVEDVDLDEAEATAEPLPAEETETAVYDDLAGWIVLNDSGESMQWTELEDGVPVVRSPRMQRKDEDIRVSLDDLSKSVESWELTDEGDSLILSAQGFTLALLNEDAGFVSTVDGLEMVTENIDFDFGEGHFIRVDFLTRALDGSWEWDEEEETLMLRIPEKNALAYQD